MAGSSHCRAREAFRVDLVFEFIMYFVSVALRFVRDSVTDFLACVPNSIARLAVKVVNDPLVWGKAGVVPEVGKDLRLWSIGQGIWLSKSVWEF